MGSTTRDSARGSARGRRFVTKGGVAALLLGLTLAGAPSAWAHVDPPDCNQTSPIIVLGVFFANGTTGVVGSLSECEQIVYKVTLKKDATDATICAFQGGVLELVTPDGM